MPARVLTAAGGSRILKRIVRIASALSREARSPPVGSPAPFLHVFASLLHPMHGSLQTKTRLILLLTAACAAPAGFAQSPGGDAGTQLQTDTSIATAGYFQLRWDAPGAVRLYESPTADFQSAQLVYEGTDSGHAVSGRSDGTLYYRLESAANGESLGMPVRVEVAHHPLGRAIAWFALGAGVFVATLLLIVIGNANADRLAGPPPSRPDGTIE